MGQGAGKCFLLYLRQPCTECSKVRDASRLRESPVPDIESSLVVVVTVECVLVYRWERG